MYFMEENIRYRSEIKYLLDTRDYVLLKNRFKSLFPLDENTPDKGFYHIRSLYFDDIGQRAYFEKLAGVEDRQKYRIRMYDFDETFIRFEKKVKRNNASYKRNAVITKEQALEAMRGEFTSYMGSDDPLLREIAMYNASCVLRPSVIVDYDREAFVFEPCNVRLTFDSHIRTGLSDFDMFNRDLPTVPVIGPKQVVLEVKYDGALPSVVRDAMEGTAAVRMAISKFILCKKYISRSDWQQER